MRTEKEIRDAIKELKKLRDNPTNDVPIHMIISGKISALKWVLKE